MLRKIKQSLVLVLFICFLTACAKDETQQISLDDMGANGNNAEEIDSEEIDLNKGDAEEQKIYVYVCGAVNQPGVYEFPIGSRAYEVIQRAGGFREDAATTYINQAKILKDETQLYIPTVDEASQEKIQKQSEEDGKVNINTASRDELMTLPGVGEAKADSIIEYREANGEFRTIEAIMQISGIKEGLFNKIKEYITI